MSQILYKIEMWTAFLSLLKVLQKTMGKPKEIKIIYETWNESYKYSKVLINAELQSFLGSLLT